MAFKPITVEKEIKGVKYVAQFNGMSARSEIAYLANEDMRKVAPYLFENVLVNPKIDNIDEHFGTDAELYDEVIEFLTGVGTADKEYFPASADDKDGGNGKK